MISKISDSKVLANSLRSMSVGFSNNEKPYMAGIEAIKEAMELLMIKDISFAIALISKDYEYKKVIEGIKQIIPKATLISLFSDNITTYSYMSNKGVAVVLFTSEINVNYYIAKGFSLSVKKSLSELFSEMNLGGKSYKNDILLLFIPGSIPLPGQNSTSIIENFTKNFDCVVGGVFGSLNLVEYQTFIVDEKVLTDHAIVLRIQTNNNYTISQSYGFHPVRPFVVSNVKGDMIISLDDGSAFYSLSSVLTKRGIDDGILKDPVKAQKLLSKYQFAVANKEKPGLFRSIVPLAITERGIKVNSFIEKDFTIWLMEFSKEEIFEGVDKMSGRVLNSLKSISGGIIFENVVRRYLLDEDYVKEKKIIWDNLKAPFIVFETIEEVIYSENTYGGSHSGSVLGLFFE